MSSRLRRALALLLVVLLILLGSSFAAQLELPAPTGPYTVGRASLHWVDASRPELLTGAPDDFREAPVQIWYPAEAGTGTPAPYFPNLEQLAPALAASGEVAPVEVFGLRFIRSHERLEAQVAGDATPYPVILLSPGNGTNVEFYSALAGELASHGYIVAGLNHPYDVAAVALQDGSVVQFAPGPPELAAHQAWVAERIAVRTADLLFALEQLGALNEQDDGIFAGRMDLSRVAVMGHSLGGISAAQACGASTQFLACLNLDGLQQGGPFSTTVNPEPPDQPFMMITKEEQLHPAIIALFEAVPSGSYRVVIPAATHDSFTDGPLLLPSPLPLPNRADEITSHVRAYTLAFFEQTLHQQRDALLERPLQTGDVALEVYPAHREAE